MQSFYISLGIIVFFYNFCDFFTFDAICIVPWHIVLFPIFMSNTAYYVTVVLICAQHTKNKPKYRCKKNKTYYFHNSTIYTNTKHLGVASWIFLHKYCELCLNCLFLFLLINFTIWLWMGSVHCFIITLSHWCKTFHNLTNSSSVL